MQDTAGIVERLLGFLDVGKAHVTAEALTQIKDVLRRYPEIAEVCITSISAISPEVCCLATRNPAAVVPQQLQGCHWCHAQAPYHPGL